MRRLGLILILCLAPFAAQADALVAGLSNHQISIRSTFTGAEIQLFGALGDKAFDARNPSDVVIVVRGPETPLTVRKKAKLGGVIWANADAEQFAAVPGFYAVLSTRPIAEIATPSLWARLHVGFENLRLSGPVSEDEAVTRAEYEDAIVRARRKVGLYLEDDQAFDVIGGQLFRARLALPANVPVGAYKVEAYVLRDNQIIGAQFSPLFVDKIGLERRIFKFANEWPWSYGVLAVLLAVWFGWAAAVILRRDS